MAKKEVGWVESRGGGNECGEMRLWPRLKLFSQGWMIITIKVWGET